MFAAPSLTNRLTRTLLSLIAVSGIAVSTLAIAAVPAQAAGIGTGRAVVHIDAPQATTIKQADGSYLLNMPKGTTGQWMGERKVASGKNKTLVGNLTGEKLASSWSNLKYTSSGVVGTLLWDATATKPQAAVVRIMQPKVTNTGVTFTLMTKQVLPATINDVMLHLDRAPKKKSVRSSSTQAFNIASDLWWSSSYDGSTSVTLRIYYSTNNNTCFSQSLTSDTGSIASVGSNTCDNIAYTNSLNATDDDVATGASSIWRCEMFDCDLTTTSMALLVTPPGQTQYTYYKAISY